VIKYKVWFADVLALFHLYVRKASVVFTFPIYTSVGISKYMQIYRELSFC